MNILSKNKLLVILTFIIDVTVIFLGFIISRAVTTTIYQDVKISYIVFLLIAVPIIFFLCVFDLYDLYELSNENIIISIILSVPASCFCAYVINHFSFRETCTVVFWIITTAIEIILLELWRIYLSQYCYKLIGKKKLLVVESAHVTSRLARKLKYSITYLYDTWYCIVDENNQEEVDFLLNKMIDEYDSVFISNNLSEKLAEEIFLKATLLSKGVCKLASFSNVAIRTGRIRQFADTPVIVEEKIGLTRIQRFIKRSFDIVFSCVGIVVSLPICAILYIAIKLDSPGPAIYKQERYTIHKRKFKVCKFRTMNVDAEKYGAQFSEKDDPRVTRVGKIIRALRLDELPQLYNIFRGDMSVVGPRPERPIFADEFCEKVKDYELRYFARAGLTGYAQIYGKYNTRASDKALMDMIYIAKYSFWLDIKLILLTIRTMFVHSSTDGVDEELDRTLNTLEKEEIRKNMSFKSEDGELCAYEFVDNYTGI